jgi:Uma2 family endonuclease
MSSVVAAPPAAVLRESMPLSCHRFTVEQYHAMIDTGILTGADRCELLEGWIIDKMTHNPPHDGCILLAQTLFLPKLPSDWVLRIQSALTLAHSASEPDLLIAQGPARRYCQSHPTPKETGLLVEVADSTLVIDREFKSLVYAQAHIEIYWIINLIDSCVEVFTEPRAGKVPAYRQRRDYPIGESVPLVLDGHEIARIPVRELLP